MALIASHDAAPAAHKGPPTSHGSTYIEIEISLLPVVTPETPRLPGGAFSVLAALQSQMRALGHVGASGPRTLREGQCASQGCGGAKMPTPMPAAIADINAPWASMIW